VYVDAGVTAGIDRYYLHRACGRPLLLIADEVIE
jgi:hypothetical protein